jgi:hypothetical protein
MKTRLNLTIEENLMDAIKAYAVKQGVSVSELVEQYFKGLTKPVGRKNIIQLLDKTAAPKIEAGADLKKAFYESQSDKYGF